MRPDTRDVRALARVLLGSAVVATAALAAPPPPAAPSAPSATPPQAPWPCPVANCTWAPDARYLPLDPAHAIVLKEGGSVTLPVGGGSTFGVALMPVAQQVSGVFGSIRWDNQPEPARVDLTADRQVWAPTSSGSFDNVVPVALGTGKRADGTQLPLTGSVMAVAVPPGATSVTIQVQGKRTLAVLGTTTWSTPPFPYTPDRYVADASWEAFQVPVNASLSVPRPAALGVPAPVTTRLATSGEDLVADGQIVRLYGTNLTVGWGLPTPEDSESIAAGFEALGFNFVRMNVLSVARHLFYTEGKRREPTADEWARFDALVAALGRHGIRLWLPMVDPDFQWGKDETAAISDRAGLPSLYPFFDPLARDRQQDAIRAMLTHVSTVTGKPLAADPILSVVELSNETGILRGWISGLLGDFPPAQLAAFQARWNDWLRTKYGTDAALAAAWAGPGANAGLRPGESLAGNAVALEPQTPWRWTSWPAKRRADLATFTAELERTYWTGLEAFVREKCGYAGIILDTQHLNVATPSLLHAKDQLGDSHFQYDHPGDTPIEQKRTPITSWPVDRQLRVLLGNAQDGQPFTVSEYNYGWPSPYEYEAPVFFAGLSARQGWAGLAWFTWRHLPVTVDGAPKVEGQMDVAVDPVKVGQLPLAAAITRGQLVGEAQGRAIMHVRDANPDAPAFPLGAEVIGTGDGRFLLDNQVRTSYADAAPATMAPSGANPITWDDKETFVVDAPGVSAVLSTGAVRSTAFLEAGGAPGAIGVVGLDKIALGEAEKWLLTVGTRAVNTGHRELGPWTIAAYGDGPVLLAPYGGSVALKHAGTPLVTRLGPDGKPTGTIPVKFDKKQGAWRVDLAAARPSTWYTVEWRRSPPDKAEGQ